MILKDEVYAIVGAALEVLNVLGTGFLEAVYQEALGRELKLRGIVHEEQRDIRIFYKGAQLQKYYIADFLCYEKIRVCPEFPIDITY